jgi:hypothetical protein
METTEPAIVTSDNWIIRIKGFSVPSGPQTVYWAARFR